MRGDDDVHVSDREMVSKEANGAPLFQIVLEGMATAKPNLATSKKQGSNFCDTCMQLHNNINAAKDSETRDHLSVVRIYHRLQATYEYRVYTSMCERVKSSPKTSEIHITFYFAENVLFPSLKRQP